MKATLLYRVNSESERDARNFVTDFERQTGKKLAIYEVDSPEGNNLARLYDVVSYPAIIAQADDGSLLQLWQGSETQMR